MAIKDWDYNCQESYFLKERIVLKPGTRVEVEVFLDNSSKNPNNPFSSPRWLKFGEYTHDEMSYRHAWTDPGPARWLGGPTQGR